VAQGPDLNETLPQLLSSPAASAPAMLAADSTDAVVVGIPDGSDDLSAGALAALAPSAEATVAKHGAQNVGAVSVTSCFVHVVPALVLLCW
jgi:hypothetical protein